MAKSRKTINNLASLNISEQEKNNILNNVSGPQEEVFGGGYVEGRGYLDSKTETQGLYDYRSDMDDLRAMAQSDSEVLGNNLKKSLYGAAAGFLDGFNYDIPEMKELLEGKEKQYGSWLHTIAKSVQDKAQAEHLKTFSRDTSFANQKTWFDLIGHRLFDFP